MSEQTKIVSLVEACMNVGIGFFVSLAAWPFVGALYDIQYTYASHIGITLIFTVISIARSYVVRRFFARGMHEAAMRLAMRFRKPTVSKKPNVDDYFNSA